MVATTSLSQLYLSSHKSTPPLLKPLLFSTNPKPPLFTQTPFLFLKTPQKPPFYYSLLSQSNLYPLHQNDPTEQKIESLLSSTKQQQHPPIKFALWVLVWASLSLAWFAASGDANSAAVVGSIRDSGFGVRTASKLRGFGCADEAVVFLMAMLPVIELRGAIPVGYWLQLRPVTLTVLSVLGNMVPVPFILLYLKKIATFTAKKNQYASHMLDLLFKKAKEKAGPVEEFQWLGLMLFVAVPFPGTGAWTGAIVASILDMPFWHAMSANFCGVVIAGLLVNLLVNLGLRYAIVTGLCLFVFSTFMWTILRNVKKSLSWGKS